MVRVCAGDKTAPLQMFDDKSCFFKERLFLLKERLFLLVWPSLPLAQSILSVPESLAEGERWVMIRPGHP